VVVEGKDTKGDEHKVEMGRGPYILSGVARKQLVLFVPCIVTHMHHEDALYVRVCPVFEHVSCKFFLHLPTHEHSTMGEGILPACWCSVGVPQ
jgi:hypothetical protein